MQNFGDRRAFLCSMAKAVGAGVCAGGAANDAFAGPALEPGALPSWVPVGSGSLRTVATTNSFLSQNGKLPGWEYAFGKMGDDYSGGVFNPYWGKLGAM